MRRARTYPMQTAVLAMLQSSSMAGGDCTNWSYEDPAAAVLRGIVCATRHRPPNDPPTVDFTISRTPVRSGEPVTFDASGTSGPDSRKLTYKRDLTLPA